jgi:hypothetical protein
MAFFVLVGAGKTLTELSPIQPLIEAGRYFILLHYNSVKLIVSITFTKGFSAIVTGL